MRPIKFRGVSLKGKRSGKVVYGDLCLIGLNGKAYIKELWCGMRASVEVDPDSVAQLVGYDANGKEVYEGDTLIDELENDYVARIYDPPQCIAALTLKEQSA